MSPALREREADITRGMRGLCDAVGALALVRDSLEDRTRTAGATAADALLLAKLDRACKHLTQAAADVPNECWGVLLKTACVADAERIAALLAAA
jgi:hypothetical protein